MGDTLKKIEEDQEEYEFLCRHYGEKFQLNDNGRLAIYGPHAKELKERYRQEQRAEKA
jgi:hypothetical protein